MGDRPKRVLRVPFDGKIKLRFHGAKITSHAGLLAAILERIQRFGVPPPLVQRG